MLFVMLIFVAGFFVIALLTTPFLERDTNFMVIRIFLATLVFAMSSDVVGAYQKHRTAAREIKDIRTRLSMADRNGYPLPDVLLAMADYNAAVESAPESVPWSYKFYGASLDERWKQYQEDRAEARRQRGAS